MPIPKDILEVKRPKNTVVVAYGKNKDRYAVRQRVGCRYVNGRHVPVNGPTIGHIIDHQYVEKKNDDMESVSQAPVDLKDWANIVFCDHLFKDMLEDLRKVYNKEDSETIYCIAILRVCYKGITDCRLQDRYESSFLSVLYPNVNLRKNRVSRFLNDLGKTYSRIVTFMRSRADQVAKDHHILLDGTLKTDDSIINSLSAFSRKAKTKGRQDISVLFAYDLEEDEPVCSKCFPGNMIDQRSYEAFISENNITHGLIVGDKGFPEKSAHKQFEAHPDLHYLNPIKRNSKFIKTHDMLEFTGILNDRDGITFKKEKCRGINKWLYSFRDADKANAEERDWLRNAKKKGYDAEKYEQKRKEFGTIVLESDIDMTPETAYKAYSDRWAIELVMRYYKTACEFDTTREHDDYSVIGSEFCDFLSTVLTFKLLKRFEDEKLLEDYTYKDLMDILKGAKKVKISDSSDWSLIRILIKNEEVLRKLDLIPKKPEPPKRKRGRPKGSRNKTASQE